RGHARKLGQPYFRGKPVSGGGRVPPTSDWPPADDHRSYPAAMDVELRPLTPEDIPAWVELLNTCAVIDGTGEHYTADDLEEELANPLLDPSRDTFAADAGGTL